MLRPKVLRFIKRVKRVDPPFGHEEDPVEDVCMELRQSLPGGYHENPCLCDVLHRAKIYVVGDFTALSGESKKFFTDSLKGRRASL